MSEQLWMTANDQEPQHLFFFVPETRLKTIAGVLSNNETVFFGFNSELELDGVGIDDCEDDLVLEPLIRASRIRGLCFTKCI